MINYVLVPVEAGSRSLSISTAPLCFSHIVLAAAIVSLPAHGQVGPRLDSHRAGNTPVAQPVLGSPFQGYFERLKARIDHAIAANPPIQNGAPLHGSTVLKLAISESGAIEGISTEQSSSPEFGQYAVRLVSNLAPFEPLSAEIRKRTGRIEVATTIAY